MKEEVRKVLDMLENKIITADQAAQLLDAMDAGEDESKETSFRTASKRQLHIKVLSDDGGKNVDIKVPMSMVKAGMGIGKGFVGKAGENNEAIKDLDWDNLNDAIGQMAEDGTVGEIVSVNKDGKSVKIWME